MLRLIRRHVKTCAHTSTLYRRCRCPIHVYGTIGGVKVRRALDQTSWAAATTEINRWTEAGRVLDDVAGVTIADAVKNYLHDLEHGQKRQPATISKHRNLLKKRLQPWCEQNEYTDLAHLDVPALRAFRATWPDSAITAQKNLERLRSFFTFCVQSKWIGSNPASALKPPKAGRPSERVKVFSADDVAKILEACDRYPARNSFGHDNAARVKAFVLTLRYSGLRIGDVVALSREHIDADGRLFLRTAKTGESVYLPLPKVTIDALNAIKGDGLYFWTGKGLRKSAVADWQRALRRVFKLAKVTGHPHMFRHTFATDLLTRAVPIEDVAVLLGHATPAVTMRYYSHFVKARRERLEERVRALWTE